MASIQMPKTNVALSWNQQQLRLPNAQLALADLVGAIKGSGSANATSLDALLAQLIRSGASLSTIMLAQQIHDSSKHATEMLRQMQMLRDHRGAISKRVDDLRALKTFLKKYGGKDDSFSKKEMIEKLPAFLEQHGLKKDYPDLERAAAGYLAAVNAHSVAKKKAESISPKNADARRKADLAALGAKQQLEGKEAECWKKLQETLLARYGFNLDTATGKVEAKKVGTIGDDGVSADEIESALATQTDELQKIDSAKELMTMRLQEIVQRKQRLVTLASNISQAENAAKKSVIGNIRA